jgi:hypothetical protein
MRYPRLRYANRQGFPIASDAVVMCFYLQHAHKSIAPAVMSALDLFRERTTPYRLDWSFDAEGQSHPLDDVEWERIRQQVLEANESAVVHLSGEPRVGGLYVDYRGLRCYPLPWPGRERDVSALFMLLPTEYLEENGPGRVRELALDLAEQLPFTSGYVDLALDGGGMDGEAAALVRTRYPGMHMTFGSPDIRMDTHVDGVHWMNFLGQPVLGKLGGISALREHLSLPGISIQELSGDRALITLGEAPNPGDTEAGETLPLHRALARLLEPYLYRNTRPLGRMTPEDMRRWERRFLD